MPKLSRPGASVLRLVGDDRHHPVDLMWMGCSPGTLRRLLRAGHLLRDEDGRIAVTPAGRAALKEAADGTTE